MALKPSFSRQDGYVRVCVAGDTSLSEMLQMIQTVRYVTMEFSDKLMLMDLRRVHEGLSGTEQITLGSEAARYFGHLHKVASIVREDRKTGYAEKAAVGTGLVIKVFTAEEPALEWLLR